ncbi:MAG TPA: cupin-like domain-containing protein [Candidatus Elarobacter sp.]|nr:cupin-like domain-containing protein [Candidatus Elarobacter sp.]
MTPRAPATWLTVRAQVEAVRPPTRRDFVARYVRRNLPVLLKGAARSWRSFARWTPQLLLERCGEREVELEYNARCVFDFNAGAATGPVEVTRLSLREAVRRVVTADGSAGAYYLREVPVDEWVPELLPLLERPPWIPLFSRRYVPRLWFGSAGCISPLHFDGGEENLLVHLYGRKEAMLFSPAQTPLLYPNLDGHLPHLSRVHAFAPDLAAFPRFQEAAAAWAEIEAGDVLYVPAGWWHAVRTLRTSISVNFWWNPLMPPRGAAPQ